jgi:hypothetical protein
LRTEAFFAASEAVADVFFQRQLYMKVFPMAPLPQADHAISASDPTVVALYSRYGEMFSALRGATWLLQPHALNVTSTTGSSVTGGDSGGEDTVVANVFELPHAPGQATLWVVMLADSSETAANLSVAYLPAGTGSDGFEVLHPRDVAVPALPIPATMVGCASAAAALEFTPSETKPTTIALAGADAGATNHSSSSCLTASAAAAGASLLWGACDGSGKQQFVFTHDGRSHGGDCADTSCNNIQLASGSDDDTTADAPLCVEFHTPAVPCPNGGELCLWTCNGGWLQNVSWTDAAASAAAGAAGGGNIELADGSHHNHTATSVDCLGKKSTAVISVEDWVGDIIDRQEAGWSALPASSVQLRGGGSTAMLKVPLRRGCAMVRTKSDAK